MRYSENHCDMLSQSVTYPLVQLTRRVAAFETSTTKLLITLYRRLVVIVNFDLIFEIQF